MVRQLIIVVVAMVAFSCGGGPSTTAHSGEQVSFRGRTIAVSDSLLRSAAGVCDTIDMGRIGEGEVVQNSIRLHNIGQMPFVILSVESSCGCATVDYSTKPIVAGENVDIGLQFDSRGFGGWQFKLIKLRTSIGDDPIRIYLSAEVE